jgi:2-amino-4-hydroxy-6-hydroxymethyldihydropteridine diphosphokinase
MTEEIKENIKDLYIGVGSNLNEPFVQIERAIEALSHLDNFDSMKISNYYESAPMGPQNQNNYINIVAMFKSGESPEVILSSLKDIESSMGRVKSSTRWSERIIDLDIIVYGDLTYKSDILTIPHRNAYQRAFVLLPLIDITPDINIPNQGFAKDLINNCLYNDIKKIEKK